MSDMRRTIWTTMLVVLVGAAATAAGPILIGRAIDTALAPPGDKSLLATFMLILLACFVVGYLANAGQFRLIGSIGQRLLARFRTQVFVAVQRLDKQFFDRHDAGDLMSRLVNDVQALDQLFSQGLTQTLGGLFSLLGIMGVMLVWQWRLAMATFVIIPLTFGVTYLFARLARRSFRRTRQTIGDVSANLQEDIAGVRVTQAFNRTEASTQRFREVNAMNRDANVAAVGVTSAFSPVLDVIGTVAIAIVAFYGGFLALEQPPVLTIGVVVGFLAYVQQFFRPIQQLSSFYAQIQSALAAAERIFELVDREPLVADRPGARLLGTEVLVAGRVTFDHVSFSYLPDEPVLEDLSFEAPAGQTVAIVGPTGGGKTTIISLLLRFYDVGGGSVSIDGIDVRDVTQESLRAHIGLVLQEPFLFSGSVADNIRYGRLDATDAEIEAAAQTAGAHQFIVNLAQGYDQPVGERGGNLSQGQRQLISFARAILRDPRILVLDEATSSVDSRTEATIQQALERITAGRTTLVIAHRLSTIRRADQILVVDEGRLKEQGTHQELLDRGGLYADLYRRQFRLQEGVPDEGKRAGVMPGAGRPGTPADPS